MAVCVSVRYVNMVIDLEFFLAFHIHSLRHAYTGFGLGLLLLLCLLPCGVKYYSCFPPLFLVLIFLCVFGSLINIWTFKTSHGVFSFYSETRGHLLSVY